MAREKILVVEDEEDIQNLVLFNLHKEGYRAVGADSGEQGLEAALSELPDLVARRHHNPPVVVPSCRYLERSKCWFDMYCDLVLSYNDIFDDDFNDLPFFLIIPIFPP